MKKYAVAWKLDKDDTMKHYYTFIIPTEKYVYKLGADYNKLTNEYKQLLHDKISIVYIHKDVSYVEFFNNTEEFEAKYPKDENGRQNYKWSV